MEEQNQSSVNLEIPSRWRRLSACLLDLLINTIINPIIIIITYRLLILINLDSIEIIFGIVIAITIIFNILFIINKKTTLGNKSVGITAVNDKNDSINGRQALSRYFIFNPAFLALIFLLIWFLASLMLYLINIGCDNITKIPFQFQNPICERRKSIRNITNRSGIFGSILFFINIIEIFFKCPTFVDKRIGIRRLYKKSK